MATILIVDDDTQLQRSFEKLLSDEVHTILTAYSGEEGLAIIRSARVDLVIMDVNLPGMNGLEAFQAMREIAPKLTGIIMTAFSTTERAIEAMKLGAFDYVTKPFDIPDMLTIINQAVEAGRLARSRVEMDVVPKTTSSEIIVGQCKIMQELYKTIGRVAPTDATVLIRGESGTGKELVARALYQHSLRASEPFLVINCVTIPENLLESELFGYEKGTFTGALTRRFGRIEQAQGGTIFLDEIGDMPLSLQPKILRLIEEKSLERLGGHETIPVNVRIIAATNRDLESAIENGAFREDLYYRLKVVTIRLPPLRERLQDIPRLIDHFLARFSRDMNVDNPGMTLEAKEIVSRYNWSGNVRELSNALQKALIFSRGCPIRPEDIAHVIEKKSEAHESIDEGYFEEITQQWIRRVLVSKKYGNAFDYLNDRFSSTIIGAALEITGGNKSIAAKLLGLSRPTLQAKIEKYRLKLETFVKEEDPISPEPLSAAGDSSLHVVNNPGTGPAKETFTSR
ncbi:MAG: sigma-54 dependent transcriptional regulator [Proteobacteria bacterium]|nr:sigma-54 dependent transcriptional regulator [Pseudomonadota bacterium]